MALFNLQDSINDVAYRLGFLNLAELAAAPAWVSETELYNWADEAVKRLAYMSALFVTTDASIPILAGFALCLLPPSHVSTLLAAVITPTGGTAGFGEEWGTLDWGTVPWGGGSPFALPDSLAYALLRLTSVRDLFALDGTWPVTNGTPKRASLDAGQVGTITLYPIPIASGMLFQVCTEFPNVAATAPFLAVSTVLQDYFSYAEMAGARGKESEMADDAMAKHYQQRMALYEQVINHLWGAGS